MRDSGLIESRTAGIAMDRPAKPAARRDPGTSSHVPPGPRAQFARTSYGRNAALHIARCWRYVDEAAIRRAFDLADDIAKLCWRLTR